MNSLSVVHLLVGLAQIDLILKHDDSTELCVAVKMCASLSFFHRGIIAKPDCAFGIWSGLELEVVRDLQADPVRFRARRS
jgi:hypothetical protein